MARVLRDMETRELSTQRVRAGKARPILVCVTTLKTHLKLKPQADYAPVSPRSLGRVLRK